MSYVLVTREIGKGTSYTQPPDPAVLPHFMARNLANHGLDATVLEPQRKLSVLWIRESPYPPEHRRHLKLPPTFDF